MEKKWDSAERIDIIFQTLFKTNTPMSITKIHELTNIPQTTLARTLRSLHRLHYLKKEKNKYTFGHINYFPPSVSSLLGLIEICNPHIKKLCQHINETIKLSVLFKNKAKVVLAHSGQTDMNVSVNIGATFPLHASAVGKTLLAFNSSLFINKFLDTAPYEKFTSSTITTKTMMKKEISRTIQNGFATDNQEYIQGIEVIACPIFFKSYVIAAISVPTFNKIQEIKKRIQRELTLVCKQINNELGKLHRLDE